MFTKGKRHKISSLNRSLAMLRFGNFVAKLAPCGSENWEPLLSSRKAFSQFSPNDARFYDDELYTPGVISKAASLVGSDTIKLSLSSDECSVTKGFDVVDPYTYSEVDLLPLDFTRFTAKMALQDLSDPSSTQIISLG